MLTTCKCWRQRCRQRYRVTFHFTCFWEWNYSDHLLLCWYTFLPSMPWWFYQQTLLTWYLALAWLPLPIPLTHDLNTKYKCSVKSIVILLLTYLFLVDLIVLYWVCTQILVNKPCITLHQFNNKLYYENILLTSLSVSVCL